MLHTVVALALIGAYMAATLTNHAADPILGVLVGYLGGAAAQLGAQKVSGGGVG